VLPSGTRPLRLITLFGAFLGIAAAGLSGYLVWAKIPNKVPVQGWTSVTVILLVTGGGTLFTLGIFAEYLGIAVKRAMGKPLYMVVNDPAHGPLARATFPAKNGSSEHARPAEPSARAER